MSRPLAAVAALALLATPLAAQAPAAPRADAPTHALVRVDLSGAEELELLASLGFDLTCGGALHGEGDDLHQEFVASAAERELLNAAGFDHEVLIADMSAHFAQRAADAAPQPGFSGSSLGAWLSPPFAQGAMASFWTWDQMVSVLDQITAAYPAITTDKVSLGQTHEGRDLWMIKISDNPDVDEAEPEVRIDAMHHAREPMSMHSTIWFMLWLCENYGSDPRATYLVNEREMYFIPLVNPDGYVYNQQTDPGGGGLWRKNRKPNGDGSFGVDLNRNYPFEWGHDDSGSSPSTSSITYRGPSPASELETQHMLAFIAVRDFVTAISAHSSSNVWLEPWGYDTNAPLADQAAYDEIGGAATPPGWPVGTGFETLGYPANGVTNDTDEGTYDILSWTPEIGNSTDGFWPQPDRLVPLAMEVRPGIAATAEAAGAWLRVLDVTETEQGDGDGFLEAGETLALTVQLRNSGVAGTSTGVVLGLTSSSPFATVVNGSEALGAVGSFTSADNAGSPLTLALAANTPGGEVIDYAVTVTAEGYTRTVDGALLVGSPRPLLVDDVEVDLGWTAGAPGDTASTGLWTRANPVGVDNGSTLVPEDDHTPGGGNTQAFVTGNGSSSAGSDDVDDGFTTLITPRLDMDGANGVVISYARWFSTSDDVFEISISDDDGASWTSLESVPGPGGAWEVPQLLLPETMDATGLMRLRFVAEDDPNNSLTYALVDDLRVDVYDEGPVASLYGEQVLGGTVRFGVSAQAGSPYTWYLSAGTADLQVGQINGKLLLDPASLFAFFSSVVPAGQLSAVDLPMPTDPAASGLVLYFQAFANQSGLKYLSNRVKLELP